MTEPRNCGFTFMVSSWSSTNVEISCGVLRRMLIPVVGVDLVADDGVAVALDADDGCGLIVGVGLFIDVVRRAEVERLDAEFTGEEALGQIDFEVELVAKKFR